MAMCPSNVQEMDQVGIIDQNIHTDLSATQDDTEISEENLNATCVSALDVIIESLWKISVFLSDFLLAYVQEAHHSLIDDDSVLPQDMLRICLLNELSLTQPLEGVSDLFLNILELLPRWNWHFQVNEVAKKACNRCKMDMEYGQRTYGLIIIAHSLRVFKSAFKDFTFESILKVIKIDKKMLCDKKGCGKRNYVDTMINNLPSVFTIALEWENNETEEEIFDTISVLATDIDISAIYRHKGDSPLTKYCLVSMVWSHRDLYNCVAYEMNRWVRYSSSEIEVIGDWDGVLRIFRKLQIRPEILFFLKTLCRGNRCFQGTDDLKTNKSFSMV